MSHKGIKEPHFLLAASNPIKLMRNLAGILDEGQISLIDAAISQEAKRIFELGESHRKFVESVPSAEWRQCVSRLYYAAYNCRRAIALRCDGAFSTESNDHQKVDLISKSVENSSTYSHKLKDLRDDRNLADYSHLAQEADLLATVEDSREFVNSFFVHAKEYPD
ncbi:hypothetical protein [Xanthomonas campestris]|uniref:hypothetical protein n=1 Tax=Xanthomonas campestris TaxID=339 RepID=UPI001E3BE991|nr:hypothetical protein [Xanthomonas campestris]MCC5074695.1 hypothetical protein [Xanthomonas campestris pv. plantaginis]